jgi:PRTRC genetic system protein B
MLSVNASLGGEMTVELKQALLVYRERYGQRGFVTIHDIDTDSGSPALKEGRLMGMSDLRELVKVVSGIKGLTYLPSHVLAYSSEGLAWFEPAQCRTLFFETQDSYLNGLSGRRYPQPPLVFIAGDKQLSVFALTKSERPTPDTELYTAPYYNTSQGRVCTGSMPLPTRLEPSQTDAISEAFFKSYFTHPSGPELLYRNWQGSYGELWEHAARLGVFPNECLSPAGLTLAEVLAC